MTLKLTPQNAEALFNLFNELVLPTDLPGLEEKLVMLHMVSIYKKLRAKWEGEKRKTYNLKINTPEAVAYRIYWRDVDITHCNYEWSMVVNHCMLIDLELGNRLTNIQHNTYKLLK